MLVVIILEMLELRRGEGAVGNDDGLDANLLMMMMMMKKRWIGFFCRELTVDGGSRIA